jgi:hypothetical protein
MLTARTEVTDRMLISGERRPRSVLAEHARHYNARRPHRGRQPRPPRPGHPVADLAQERTKRRPVPGGLINQYEPAAQMHRSRPTAEFWNPTSRTCRRRPPPDVTVNDLYLLFSTAPADQRPAARARWLTLVLPGLPTHARTTDS